MNGGDPLVQEGENPEWISWLRAVSESELARFEEELDPGQQGYIRCLAHATNMALCLNGGMREIQDEKPEG